MSDVRNCRYSPQGSERLKRRLIFNVPMRETREVTTGTLRSVGSRQVSILPVSADQDGKRETLT
jgi:hypothetical protein